MEEDMNFARPGDKKLRDFIQNYLNETGTDGSSHQDFKHSYLRVSKSKRSSAHSELRDSLNNSDSTENETSRREFEQWASNLGTNDYSSLKQNLEGFLVHSNTSFERVAQWLSVPRQYEPGHREPSPSVNEGLRRCLQEIMNEQRQQPSGFDSWLGNHEQRNSPVSHDSSRTTERQNDISPLNIRIETPCPPVPVLIPGTQSHENYLLTQHIHEAQSAMATHLPEVDVAREVAAAWGSIEDEDFVTPWYTFVIRFLMFPLGLLIFYFIFWRMYNYPRSGIWWGDLCAWVFILSEAICFLFGMTHWVWMWNLKFRKRVTQAELNLTDADLPTVDIMIPCYSEPTEIVEMTLKACYDMDYPSEKVTCYVCDDGGKREMKNMVERAAVEYKGRMKTRYVARIKIKGVPHHAKAGNLNNCILNEGSTGQLIIILDCDMLPEPCMARTVAPFFFKKLPKSLPSDVEYGRRKAEFDHGVGLLQTPQAFYNLDSKDLLGQSYAFFYECLMSGWDGSGCTPCCGTGVVFNRSALTAVGGFSVGSITEDFKTSLNLCANGYECKFFLQRLTRGVSPKELNAFMIQRLRWAVGAIQIVRASNPLFTKGLHYRARWLYFFSTVGIVYIIPVCCMGIIMYSTILAGAPISFGPTTFEGYLILGGTSVGLMMLMQYLAGWRLSFRDYLRALQDNFTVFMTLIRAILIGFCGMEMGFAVTAKDVSFDLKANLFHAAPHLFVYIFSGVATIKGIFEMLADNGVIKIPWTTDYNVDLLYFSLLWTIFLWVMISAPPRMLLYGYLRSRREAKAGKCKNANVPALQELPCTPMNIFPPLTPDLYKQSTEEDEYVDARNPSVHSTTSDSDLHTVNAPPQNIPRNISAAF